MLILLLHLATDSVIFLLLLDNGVMHDDTETSVFIVNFCLSLHFQILSDKFIS